MLDALNNSGLFSGTTGFSNVVDTNKNYQKRLSKVFELENYKKLDVNRMKKVAANYGMNLKIENSKINLVDSADYDLICKLLGDYYKKGEVSGESYGTFAGEHIKN